MEYIITGIVFFIIFSVIILIHEGGHFWAARIGKIGIEEFGFGLPPRLKGWKNKKSGVVYSLNWIPFGGFVRMLGEDDPKNKKAQKDPSAFNNRPLGARIFAVSAGVIMNFILGWLLLFIGFTAGMKPIVFSAEGLIKVHEAGLTLYDDTGVWIEKVVKDSPADRAGVKPGDFVTHVDVTAVDSADEFLDVKRQGLRGKGFHLTVVRKDYSENLAGNEGESFAAVVTPDEEGNLGVVLSDLPYIYDLKKERYPIHIAGVKALESVGILTVATVKMLGEVVKELVSKLSVPDGVGGPVAIAQMTHGFVSMGDIIEILKFAALLSISIAVINIMPFPALDGGRLAFLLAELVSGKKPSARIETIIHGTGFLLLLLLLVVVTWNDIVRIFST